MKLWIGGIIEAEIANSFREIRNNLENRINQLIEGRYYGEGLNTWDVIVAITLNPPKEHIKYNKRSKETDCRLIIDYQSFAQAETHKKEELLVEIILISIQKLSSKSIVDFDFISLQQDVSTALTMS